MQFQVIQLFFRWWLQIRLNISMMICSPHHIIWRLWATASRILYTRVMALALQQDRGSWHQVRHLVSHEELWFQTLQVPPDLDQGAVGAVCGVAVQVARIARRLLGSSVSDDDLWRLVGLLVMLVTPRAALAPSWTQHWLQLLSLKLSQSSLQHQIKDS